MSGNVAPVTNGAGVAAVLSVAIGSFTLGVLALAGDASPGIKQSLNWWHPTGALSGVTAIAIAVWLAVWFVLDRRWVNREISIRPVGLAAGLLLLGGLLLTFPPFMDFLQGK